jgi:hypothetical protein
MPFMANIDYLTRYKGRFPSGWGALIGPAATGAYPPSSCHIIFTLDLPSQGIYPDLLGFLSHPINLIKEFDINRSN